MGPFSFTAATRVRLPYGTPDLSSVFAVFPCFPQVQKRPLTKSLCWKILGYKVLIGDARDSAVGDVIVKEGYS
jgi:hypothetical protein